VSAEKPADVEMVQDATPVKQLSFTQQQQDQVVSLNEVSGDQAKQEN
jgi:hypothetical protein